MPARWIASTSTRPTTPARVPGNTTTTTSMGMTAADRDALDVKVEAIVLARTCLKRRTSRGAHISNSLAYSATSLAHFAYCHQGKFPRLLPCSGIPSEPTARPQSLEAKGMAFIHVTINGMEGKNMKLITRHYINGEFVESHGKETFDLINPSTQELIGRVTLGDEEDTRRAIAAA